MKDTIRFILLTPEGDEVSNNAMQRAITHIKHLEFCLISKTRLITLKIFSPLGPTKMCLMN